MRESYIVSYDISEPQRLARVARICEDSGERIQYSVFECLLNDSDLIRLRARLEKTIDRSADQVLFIRLGGAEGRIQSLGRKYEQTERVAIIL